MRVAPVGFIENPQEIDVEPITIPVCGLRGDKCVCEDFNFLPTLPWGNTFALIDALETGVVAMAGNTVKWLLGCMVSDEERQRLRDFLGDPGTLIEQDTVEGIYKVLTETYGERPTLPRRSSSGTGDSTAATSKDGSSAAVSGSKKKRSRAA